MCLCVCYFSLGSSLKLILTIFFPFFGLSFWGVFSYWSKTNKSKTQEITETIFVYMWFCGHIYEPEVENKKGATVYGEYVERHFCLWWICVSDFFGGWEREF